MSRDRPARRPAPEVGEVRCGRVRVRRRRGASDRRLAAGHGVPERADPGHARDDRVHVHRLRQHDAGRRASVRVPARRARPDRAGRDHRAVGADPAGAPVGYVLEPAPVAPGRGEHVLVRGACDRPAGEHRPDAGRARVLGRRHDRAEHAHRRATVEPKLQPHRHVQLHGDRQHDSAAVHGVRVPDRHARPGPVDGVLQPGDLLEPDDGDAHRRGSRDRPGRDGRPDPGALHLDGLRAAELRRSQHHADRLRRRHGQRGRLVGELRLPDRPHGHLGRDRRPGRDPAGPGCRAERARAVPLQPAERRPGLRASERAARAVERVAQRRPQHRRHAAGEQATSSRARSRGTTSRA